MAIIYIFLIISLHSHRKRKKKVAPDSRTDAERNIKWTPHSTSSPPLPPAYGYYPAQLGPDKPSDPNYPPLPSVIY
ncbi:hypothetical protein CHS0354_028131 [Potamilus streckersoni]|uniref:Uncharacterized protein n=1 Tax=Potamilus streckersoni TaxID=2493646 RepID=A0AAE0TIW7_9BIVA|nr:hypothetical protein CHS0354_028131 [Potamilus streckersoni]